MIKIIVNGASGKMGSLAVKHIEAEAEFDLVATPKRGDDLAAVIKASHADIVLDLTAADSAFENTKIIIEAGASPVIGTSGLTTGQITALQALAKLYNVSGIIVPNFSISAVLMMQFSETACSYFDDIKITETHHPAKKDKPSGTARRTAELMASAKHIDYADIKIESHRKADAVAEQAVIFSNQYESLSIIQNSFDRECFMPGVILACRNVTQLGGLVVGLDKLL